MTLYSLFGEHAHTLRRPILQSTGSKPRFGAATLTKTVIDGVNRL